ncbi:hypothetical protein WAJ24_21665, partial [Acinetobacter baumannii]
LKNYNNSFNYYTIATFRIYNSIKVLPIGELSHTQVTGRGMLLGSQSQSINKLINACNPDEVTRLLITDKFLSDSLMSDNYNITSYV